MGCRELKSGWGTGPKWESQEAVGTGGAGANQEDDFLGREDGEGSLLTGNAKVCLVMEIQRQATKSAEVWAAGKESRGASRVLRWPVFVPGISTVATVSFL